MGRSSAGFERQAALGGGVEGGAAARDAELDAGGSQLRGQRERRINIISNVKSRARSAVA